MSIKNPDIKFLAVIPARAGSKGVHRKNIKPLNGVPLIFYTIDTVRSLLSDQNICISTNDIDLVDLVRQQRNMLVPFIRPEELATDDAGMHEVLVHALDYYASKGKLFDAIILLQPTSPLRTEQNIKEAMQLYLTENCDMVVSVKETKSNPYFTLFEENIKGLLIQSKSGNYARRQDCPKVYEYNGAIYIINVESLKKSRMNKFSRIKKYIMSDEASIDIDTAFDWKMAEILLGSKST